MRESGTHDLTLMRIPYIDLTTVLPEIVTPETDLLPDIDPMEMPWPPVQWLFSKRRFEPCDRQP